MDYYRQHHTDLTTADTRAILASIDDDTARQHLAILAKQASPLQRRAHTIRLRALRTHHPDLPGLDELIDILNPDNTAT